MSWWKNDSAFTIGCVWLCHLYADWIVSCAVSGTVDPSVWLSDGSGMTDWSVPEVVFNDHESSGNTFTRQARHFKPTKKCAISIVFDDAGQRAWITRRGEQILRDVLHALRAYPKLFVQIIRTRHKPWSLIYVFFEVFYTWQNLIQFKQRI